MSRPKELIIVRQKYTPFGGGERFLAQAMQALADQGMRIRILCRDWEGNADYSITRLPVGSLTRRMRDKAFAKMACRHIEASGDVLVQSHERIPCCDIYRAGDGVHREWLAQRARKRGRLSRLLGRISPYHRYILAAERRLFESKRLKAVICNSYMVKNEIQNHFDVPDEKFAVIHNGVDSLRFHPGLSEKYRTGLRKELGIPQNALIYLFVGSGFERKGLDSLLKAFKTTDSNSRLLIVGKDRHSSRYQKKAVKLGIGNQVHFLGAQIDVAPYYGVADVFVLPTLYDPLPNALLEAMACGLPVITSLKCGGIDLIKNNQNGLLCDALDIGHIADHMARCADARLRKRLGSGAQKTVAALTVEDMSEAFQALYANLTR